tara:strand:- start:455 stop:955 length:501 start_codon:yes stop_codon:yes gene_type:complete
MFKTIFKTQAQKNKEKQETLFWDFVSKDPLVVAAVNSTFPHKDEAFNRFQQILKDERKKSRKQGLGYSALVTTGSALSGYGMTTTGFLLLSPLVGIGVGVSTALVFLGVSKLLPMIFDQKLNRETSEIKFSFEVENNFKQKDPEAFWPAFKQRENLGKAKISSPKI